MQDETGNPAEDHAMNVIKKHYGNRLTDRSQVPLINHIIEGVAILRHISAHSIAVRAFCLHPLFQRDQDFRDLGERYLYMHDIDWFAAVYAVEYRNIANGYLSCMTKPDSGVAIGPTTIVQKMLVADKVQNRKDFEIYNRGKVLNSDRMDEYFSDWMTALSIDDSMYAELVDVAAAATG